MRTRIIAITGSRPPGPSAPESERSAWLALRDHGYAWIDSLPVDEIVLFEGGAPGIDRELGLRARRRGIWVLATEDQELVEGNDWGDTFWGVCRGEGENNLGKILMRVRAELRQP